MSALNKVIDALHHHRKNLSDAYWIPGLWIDFETEVAQNLNPYDFYAERLKAILESPTKSLVNNPHSEDWTRYAITYNLFPRVSAAFDHNQNDHLNIQPNDNGWRETGTLLKCIALLPYIGSMGFNTVHLLPITAIGRDGRKGNLGSPYAIRNPYQLDDNLAEPALPDISVDVLFQAFVEAAHHLGIRVVMEFILRTASRDSEWVKDHPDWFYWIRSDIPDRQNGNAKHFGPPLWDWDVASAVYHKIGNHERHDLPAPNQDYQNQYTQPPTKESIRMENGRWLGTLEDGTHVRIPGAFTDWPLENNQPLWSDVTYLRLYDHPDFNYMAYNTLRMYDDRLAQPDHIKHDLWDAIIGILPHYQETCGIDGAMIDMGHAVPAELMKRIMQRAREINPEFAFWSEDFHPNRSTHERGYNAGMGHLIFDLHLPEKMQHHIDYLAHNTPDITIFTAAENHNTPRAASRENALGFCHQALMYMVGLPSMPFILSGFEFFEDHPLNTGVNFTQEEMHKYDQKKLPLFSEWAFDWTRHGNMVGAIRYSMHLRNEYRELLTDTDPATMITGSSDNPNLLVFARQKDGVTLLFVFNMTMWDFQSGEAQLYAQDYIAKGLWGYEGTKLLSGNLSVHVEIGGGHSMMFKAEDVD